ENAVPVLKQLNALAKAEDPSRPTTLASNKDNDKIGGITDIWAQNQYYMWYAGGPVSLLSTLLDNLRTSYPAQPVGISEYGAGAALSHQSDNANDGIGFVPTFDFSGTTRTERRHRLRSDLRFQRDHAHGLPAGELCQPGAR